MTLEKIHSPFELVAAELRKLGLTIRRLPGEYLVNYRNGADATARMADDLDQALEVGRAMAADRASDRAATKSRPRRRWQRKKMTPRTRRRRFILAHNRRLRTRAPRKQRDER